MQMQIKFINQNNLLTFTYTGIVVVLHRQAAGNVKNQCDVTLFTIRKAFEVDCIPTFLYHKASGAVFYTKVFVFREHFLKALLYGIERFVMILRIETRFHTIFFILALIVPVEELFPTGAGKRITDNLLLAFLLTVDSLVDIDR